MPPPPTCRENKKYYFPCRKYYSLHQNWLDSIFHYNLLVSTRNLRMSWELRTWDLRASNWGLTSVTNVDSVFIKLMTAGITCIFIQVNVKTAKLRAQVKIRQLYPKKWCETLFSIIYPKKSPWHLYAIIIFHFTLKNLNAINLISKHLVLCGYENRQRFHNCRNSNI